MPSHQPKIPIEKDATPEQRTAFAVALRKLADFIETTEAPIDRDALYISLPALSSYSLSKDPNADAFLSRPRALIKSIGGFVRKDPNGEAMRFTRHFDSLHENNYIGRVSVTWDITREKVCVARTTGRTMTVKSHRYADDGAAAELRKQLDALRITEVVPVVEYDCAPVLGVPDDQEIIDATGSVLA